MSAVIIVSADIPFLRTIFIKMIKKVHGESTVMLIHKKYFDIKFNDYVVFLC